MAIDFKGAHFPKSAILYGVFWFFCKFLSVYKRPYLWTQLCSELRKDFEWRTIVVGELLLADHMSDVDASDCS